MPDLAFFSHVLAVFQPKATNKVHSIDPVMNDIIQSIIIVDLFRPKFGFMIRNIVWHIAIGKPGSLETSSEFRSLTR